MKRYIKSNRDDEYFGQIAYDKYGDMILSKLNGKKISKRRDKAEEPGGLIYESKQLGIDLWDLLEALEGMCHNGTAREIDDSTYLVGDIRSCINSATNTCNIASKPVFGDDDFEEDESDKPYKVRGYYGRNFSGLADYDEFDNPSDAEDYVWELVNHGEYVEYESPDSLYTRRFTPEQLDKTFEEIGEVYDITDEEI